VWLSTQLWDNWRGRWLLECWLKRHLISGSSVLYCDRVLLLPVPGPMQESSIAEAYASTKEDQSLQLWEVLIEEDQPFLEGRNNCYWIEHHLRCSVNIRALPFEDEQGIFRRVELHGAVTDCLERLNWNAESMGSTLVHQISSGVTRVQMKPGQLPKAKLWKF